MGICKWLYGLYYPEGCADSSIKLSADRLNDAKNALWKKNSKYVVWPPDDYREALYYFQGEVPDPMPGYKRTANPISIEFNKYYFTADIEMLSFKIFEGSSEIKDTKILDKKEDHNGMLDAFQFVLFPLKELKQGQRYNIEFKYKYEGREKTISWSFDTKKL